MNRWIVFVRERLPIPTYLLLVGGLALSGLALSGGSWTPLLLGVAAGALLLFFTTLRIMDEYKDYDKDCLAHPDRPLPRGILSLQEVRRVIYSCIVCMLALSVVVGALTHMHAALCYLVITGYLWLMYREFFAGTWLDKRPFLYGLSHQLILIPLCLLSPLIGHAPLATLSSFPIADVVVFGLLVLSSFFTYEVCRKLDPKALPELGTYLVHYGKGRTALIVVLLLVLGACIAPLLDLHTILWPVQALVFLSLGILYLAPQSYKITEGIATLSLLIHLWVLPALSFSASLF